MPGSVSDSYNGPPICKCEHFKEVHAANGLCEAPDCICPAFREIPLEKSQLGKAMNDFLNAGRKQ